jgi:acyl-CoA thioester hydrolase
MELPVYTFDIDFAGIVSNIVYLRWSEIWRLQLLERIGLSVPEMMRSGVVPTMVRQELNYRRSMRLGETVRLEGWIERIGRSSATLWLEMREAASGELCCDNRQVMVMVDGRSGQSMPIPEEYRRRMEL